MQATQLFAIDDDNDDDSDEENDKEVA